MPFGKTQSVQVMFLHLQNKDIGLDAKGHLSTKPQCVFYVCFFLIKKTYFFNPT